jgi:signal transduction histidine kinase
MIRLAVDIRVELSKTIEHARQDLDESLAQLAKLPAVDADRLTYAAHALNNYLMVVSTITHMLGREIGTTSSPDVQDRLTALNEATRLMKAVVRQLILPSDESGGKLIFLPVDLTFVATAACEEYDTIAAKKDIRIIREIMDRPLNGWSDRIALGAVIDNLMSNAVKYSRHGGSIGVREYQLDDQGILAVTDSGPGIRSDEASRLFSRGGRLSSQPTGGETSSGYGLAIAKDLMNALGGRIWWENHASGATFSVALPLYNPAQHTAGQ